MKECFNTLDPLIVLQIICLCPLHYKSNQMKKSVVHLSIHKGVPTVERLPRLQLDSQGSKISVFFFFFLLLLLFSFSEVV